MHGLGAAIKMLSLTWSDATPDTFRNCCLRVALGTEPAHPERGVRTKTAAWANCGKSSLTFLMLCRMECPLRCYFWADSQKLFFFRTGSRAEIWLFCKAIPKFGFSGVKSTNVLSNTRFVLSEGILIITCFKLVVVQTSEFSSKMLWKIWLLFGNEPVMTVKKGKACIAKNLLLCCSEQWPEWCFWIWECPKCLLALFFWTGKFLMQGAGLLCCLCLGFLDCESTHFYAHYIFSNQSINRRLQHFVRLQRKHP